jgi:hypothetical protein
MGDDLLTVSQAAELLGRTTKRTYKYLGKGWLTPVRVGDAPKLKRVRVCREEVEQLRSRLA